MRIWPNTYILQYLKGSITHEDDYLNDANIVPDELDFLLKMIICGSNRMSSKRVERLSNSLGQDICRAATNGEWKLPKHLLVCMSLRHLFRSKELITLMNRPGHCENHSFSLELETAIAKSLHQKSSILTNKIVSKPAGPSVFHSKFDNFDQLFNSLSGGGSVHTAHGIML